MWCTYFWVLQLYSTLQSTKTRPPHSAHFWEKIFMHLGTILLVGKHWWILAHIWEIILYHTICISKDHNILNLLMGRVKTRPEIFLANPTRPEQFFWEPAPTLGPVVNFEKPEWPKVKNSWELSLILYIFLQRGTELLLSN